MKEKFDTQSQTWIPLGGNETPADGSLLRQTSPSGAVVKTRWYARPTIDGPTLHQAKLGALYLQAKKVIEARETWYAQGEKDLWPELEAEAAAYLADNNDKGRHLTAREALGLSVSQQVTDNTVAITAMVGFVAAVIVNRTVHKDAMQALLDANNLAGLAAYDFTSGWPVV